MDIASFVFIFGGLFIGYKISKRTGTSFLIILFGFKRRAFVELSTSQEKICLILLFVWFFFFAFLDVNNIKMVSDVVMTIAPNR